MTLTILALIATLALFLLGLLQWWLNLSDLARVERSVWPEQADDASLLTRNSALDRLVLRSRWGADVERAVTVSGLPIRPGQFVLAAFAVCVVLGLFLGSALSWLLFPVGMGLGVWAIRAFLKRQVNQRREAFIAQMPELARTLSNASSAGLSVRTAIGLAAEELDEPARAELREVSAQLTLGRSLDDALTAMEKRLPSREVSVLVSSLIVSARSGGALVTALRDIADTLETRKELRREIRTTYAQTVATAYAVLGMGILSLFLLERVNPGTVDAMLRSNIGRLTLIVSGGIYATAIWAVRRMTRVEV